MSGIFQEGELQPTPGKVKRHRKRIKITQTNKCTFFVILDHMKFKNNIEYKHKSNITGSTKHVHILRRFDEYYCIVFVLLCSMNIYKLQVKFYGH